MLKSFFLPGFLSSSQDAILLDLILLVHVIVASGCRFLLAMGAPPLPAGSASIAAAPAAATPPQP